MPAELTSLLRAHRAQQLAMQMRAGDQWNDGGWVFTDEPGRPLNDVGDYRRWRALSKTAGVRDARLHDARHTAATTAAPRRLRTRRDRHHGLPPER